jgi:hypothetical protein
MLQQQLLGNMKGNTALYAGNARGKLSSARLLEKLEEHFACHDASRNPSLYGDVRRSVNRLLDTDDPPSEEDIRRLGAFVEVVARYSQDHPAELTEFRYVLERLAEGEELIYKDKQVLVELRAYADKLQAELSSYRFTGCEEVQPGRYVVEVEISPIMPLEQITLTVDITPQQLDIPSGDGKMMPAGVRNAIVERAADDLISTMRRRAEAPDSSHINYREEIRRMSEEEKMFQREAYQQEYTQTRVLPPAGSTSAL